MKDNSKRARIAIILIGVILLLDMFTVLSSYMQVTLLQEIELGIDVSDESVNMNDLREGIIGILYTIVYIVSTVTFIRWFRRAYYNLHTQRKHLSFAEGWAAGCWFIPILNLFRPYSIMKELYEETYQILSAKSATYNHRPNLIFVVLWWILWVIAGFIGNAETRILLRAETAEEYILASNISIVSGLIGIPLALLAIKVIYDYSKMENELYALRPKTDGEIDFDADENILDAFK